MDISMQQFMIVLVLGFIFIAAYNCHRAKTKVHCTFTRRDKTIGKKWARAKNGERIEFEGGWYYVIMKRIRLQAMDGGLNAIFPTMVRCLNFSYKSIYPEDPETGEVGAETPESRKNLNKREDIEALELGSQRALQGKGAKVPLMGGGWLPVVLVVGVVAIGYFVFQMRGQIDSLGNAINVLQQMMMK